MKLRALSLIRRLSASNAINPKICIVGSGPAGFYAAQYMASRLESAQIDIFERLPVPFGLVRFGVAPDHADLKKCMNAFTKTAQLKNVRFLGNINLGKDITLKELKDAYHIILLSYGVDDNRKLDIKGSQLQNIFDARDFVGWYNGVPWNKNLPVDLSGETAAIFGHGNVAIDVARILLSPIDKLKTTDITEHSLAILSQSKIKQVSLIGRRGPLQVSFTTKELRELLNMKNCSTIWRSEDMNTIPDLIPQLVKPRKRLTELMVDKFQKSNPQPGDKLLKMIFSRSPKEFKGKVKIEKIILGVNQLEGEDLLNKKPVMTDQEETIDSSLVVSSIGYKSVQADHDIPFDERKAVIRNLHGKVDDGLYAAGWVAKGASGVLAHTMEHAFGVASVILKDLGQQGVDNEKPGFDYIGKILLERDIQVVTWKDWLKIDEFEKKEGEKVNKPREKIVDVEKMLQVAGS